MEGDREHRDIDKRVRARGDTHGTVAYVLVLSVGEVPPNTILDTMI